MDALLFAYVPRRARMRVAIVRETPSNCRALRLVDYVQ